MLKFNSFRAERYLRTRFVESRFLLASENTDLQLEMIDKTRQTIKSTIGNVAVDDSWKTELYEITTEVTNVAGTTLSLDTTLIDLVTIGDEVFKGSTRINTISSIDTGANTITLPSIGSVVLGDTITIKIRNTLLIRQGEAWFEGMPFMMQGGEDSLVSGSNLAMGLTIPVGGGTAYVTAQDEPNGLGKLLVFNNGGTTPVGQYRIVISAKEELITNTEDPFLKNANIPESTAQKMRLVYRINVVPESEQDESPVPYTDSTTSGNLSNKIVVTPIAGGEGSEASRTSLSGSQEIDGRDIEINIRNTTGSNKLPSGASEQQEFTNGRFIDSVGNEYHLNLITTATTANQVTLRLDKAPGQPDPKIIDGSPYYLIKKDIFVTDDTSGVPQGNLYYPIATATLSAGLGFTHSSSLIDRRGRVISKETIEEITNTKFSLKLIEGGSISWEVAGTELLEWDASFQIINPHGPAQTIASGQASLIEDSSVVYVMDLENGGAIEKGTVAATITGGSTVLATSGNPDLSDVVAGNIIRIGTEVRYITAIDNISKLITVNSSISSTGSATIYKDVYYQATAPLSENTFTLATRKNGKIHFSNLELSSGETSNIGSAIPQALLDYIGTPSANDSTPDYGINQVTEIETVDPADINDSEYFFINTVNDGIEYYVWFDKSGSAVDPAVAGRTGLEVDISAAANAFEVADALAAAIDGLADFGATSTGSSNLVTVTHTFVGTSTPAYNINLDSQFLIDVTQVGTPANLTQGISLTNAIAVLDAAVQTINNALEEPIYDEVLRFPTGLVAGTDITLPANTRKNNAVQYYVADSGALQIFINGRYVTKDEEWFSVTDNTVDFADDLPNDTTLHFRISALAGASVADSGGGGGTGGDEWSDPVDSNIIPDFNNTRDLGSAAKKFKDGYFAGKLTVDGVIDPTGLELVPQAVNPLAAGQRGIWINTSNQLMLEDGASNTNISQELEDVIAGTATVNISRTYTNSTGVTIPANTVVYSPSANLIAPADGAVDASSLIIGITSEEITTGSSGKVVIAGAVEGVTGFTHNSHLYLGLTAGSITETKPSVGGGFPVSFRVILLGVVVDDVLILQINHIGEL